MTEMREYWGTSESQVQCFPFYTILLAVGNPVIDLFSLDVEGAELHVLKSIPWDLVKINVILIEVEHSDESRLDTFLKAKNYTRVPDTNFPADKVYVRNDFKSVTDNETSENSIETQSKTDLQSTDLVD